MAKIVQICNSPETEHDHAETLVLTNMGELWVFRDSGKAEWEKVDLPPELQPHKPLTAKETAASI